MVIKAIKPPKALAALAAAEQEAVDTIARANLAMESLKTVNTPMSPRSYGGSSTTSFSKHNLFEDSSRIMSSDRSRSMSLESLEQDFSASKKLKASDLKKLSVRIPKVNKVLQNQLFGGTQVFGSSLVSPVTES